MSAMPSSVFSPGVSLSSILMPRAQSSATSARMSLTCHAAWVCWSAVPTGAFGHVQVGAVAAPQYDGVLVLPVDLQPELAVAELPGCSEVGGRQHGVIGWFPSMEMSLLLSGCPPAYAGWMLALWWNRF